MSSVEVTDSLASARPRSRPTAREFASNADDAGDAGTTDHRIQDLYKRGPMHKTEEFTAVAAAMAKIEFCMMQTVGEHGINTRPMSNNGEVQYDGDNWFFARSSSAKIAEIARDHRVQLTFADHNGPSFISVWGSGTVVTDIDLKKKLWHKSLERWFENGPEDSEVCLIKVSAHRIQAWGRLGDFVLE
jgi:general stress protein 26